MRHGRSGTCIDLALLFAACLELIDVYPVIFLLHGHALPGYWRHPRFHEDYAAVRMPQPQVAPPAEAARNSSGTAQKTAWQAGGKAAHAEILQRIRARELVPIETVRLTERGGFLEAIESGVEALSVAADFHSVLDIVTARGMHITPLPVAQDGPA